jgi:hypothetical protein
LTVKREKYGPIYLHKDTYIYKFMPRFLFQPDSIDGYDFHPIPIDIHLGVLKIPTEELFHDFAINNTDTIMWVVTDRKF